MSEETAAIPEGETTVNDSLAATEIQEVKEFVPVTRFTHTLDIKSDDRSFINYSQPKNFYADTFLRDDSIDKTKNLNIRNTLAISLLEGFNKWAVAGLTAYATYDYRRYTLPDTLPTSPTEVLEKQNEYSLNMGGVLQAARRSIGGRRRPGRVPVRGRRTHELQAVERGCSVRSKSIHQE